jgi:type IV secretory pathway VirB10-like protein
MALNMTSGAKAELQKAKLGSPDQKVAETAAVSAAPVAATPSVANAAPPAPAATPPATSAAPVASPPPPSQTAKADAPAPVADESADKPIVNMRFEAALLERVDQSRKSQSISRTAWFHRAAHKALGDKID